MFVFIAGMVGVIVGALIVTASAALHSSYKERKEVRYRELEHLVKEIESLNLLNKKVKEILQKRELYIDRSIEYLSMDDCFISIDDFIEDKKRKMQRLSNEPLHYFKAIK